MILFTSRQLHYLVDKGGQFNENYYGMKHELIECITSEQARPMFPSCHPAPCSLVITPQLIECITSEQVYVDLNDVDLLVTTYLLLTTYYLLLTTDYHH